MKEKWVLPIAAAAVLGLGYLWYEHNKAQQAANAPSGAANNISVLSQTPLQESQSGSDIVPISVTSPTGFTAQDYNYGAQVETPIGTNGLFDIVANPSGGGTVSSDFTIVPSGNVNSYNAYHSVIG